MARARLLFVVNADWFFVSHRLPLAIQARSSGFEVAVCAGESEARTRIEREGFTFLPLPIARGGTDPRQDVTTIAALVRAYRAWRPDIVHHVTIKPVLYGSLAARLVGVGGVVNAVSGLGSAFIDTEARGRRHRALRTGLREAYRIALHGRGTRTIFQNSDDLEGFVSAGLAPSSRVHLIRGSGVAFERFDVSPLPEGPPVVLLPARLLRDKGVVEFVEAARTLKPRFPDARFVLVGRIDPGNPSAISRAEVDGWVNSGFVEWWGAKSHEEMPVVYASATLVVLPSYREGLPLSLAEAAACGRPIVTTNVPGCRDTVEDGRSGWLCRAQDGTSLATAIAEALSSRHELVRRGSRAATLARERFSLEQVIAQTLDVYERSLAANGLR